MSAARAVKMIRSGALHCGLGTTFLHLTLKTVSDAFSSLVIEKTGPYQTNGDRESWDSKRASTYVPESTENNSTRTPNGVDAWM